MNRDLKPPRCAFCEAHLGEPSGDDLQQSHTCPHCKAYYVFRAIDDCWMVPEEAAEYFGATAEQIECEVVRDFERLLVYPGQLPEEGIEICLVFARVKP